MRRRGLRLVVLLLVVVLCGRSSARPNPPGKTSTDFYRSGQELLLALYPELNGKHYALSIESALPYDDPASMAYVFKLSVGEGPKFLTKGCCFGGHIGHDVIGLPQPPPPSGVPPSLPPPAVPKQPVPRRPDVDERGAEHFKQYLSTVFTFDKQGRLKDFSAEGPAINDGEGDRRIFETVSAHPEWTYGQVISTLKANGTKYGPDDKEEFIRNLPLQKLEPFLGKLNLESVAFVPLDERRTAIASWPNWTVDVSAKQADGTVLKYEMYFDHRDGKLFALFVVPMTPEKPE